MEFELKATFKTTCQELFTSWLSNQNRTKLIGASAEVSNSIGGNYSDYDGYIFGKNLEIEPYKRIVQTWRTTEFELSHEDSVVQLLFKEINGNTELIVIHKNLPELLAEKYKRGWYDFYFKPISKYFS